MFLIGARILSGTVSAEQAGEAFARLADVLVRALHRAVEEHFAAAHGRMRGQESAVLAIGKLGGREMTAASDLDLIIVYDFDEAHPESDGARPLYGTQYFARLTQRLISALSAQTNYGALYQVDMRLRPSGRSGPVATLLGSFESYQENEAWTWEHLALTRARVVSGSPAFAARVEKVIGDVLRRPRDAEAIAGDVVEMRARDRDREGRRGALGPEIRRGRTDRPRIHRAIPAARARGRRIRTSSIPRPRACSTRRRGSACCRRRMPRCCARRCGSIRI